MNQEAYSLIKGALSQKRQASHTERFNMDNLTLTECLAELRVTPTTMLPPTEPLFRMYDVPCFYRGELVAVCGKAKSGKTLFLSVIMAACLTQKVLALERHTDLTDPTDGCSGSLRSKSKENLEENLSKDSTDIKPLRVLWIDTEQSQQSTQDIMVNRIMPLVRGHTDSTDKDIQVGDFDDCFFAYNLRGLGFERRRELMEAAIVQVKPDLVVIDGIKDLVTDINDAIQATVIMEQLMALAQAHHCCIVNVLHQNKSEADHNMRGSIGTELSNKAFEVYTCEFIERYDTFKVSQRLSRRDRIKRRLYYKLDDDHIPVECDEVPEQARDILGRYTSQSDTETEETATDAKDLAKLFTSAMEGRQQRPYSELMAVALKHFGVKDAQTYYAYVKEAEEQGIIRKVEHPDTKVTWVELVDNEIPF